MNEKTLLFGFGTDEEHCEADTFETIEELLKYAQASWDEKDGNPFDEDCDYSGFIYVGTAENFEPADFAPSLDDIADQMTDRFYCEHNVDDDADVQISKRKEAEEKWKAFVNEHFDIPCTMTCSWFGLYDLKAHKWAERYAGFSNYVKEGDA